MLKLHTVRYAEFHGRDAKLQRRLKITAHDHNHGNDGDRECVISPILTALMISPWVQGLQQQQHGGTVDGCNNETDTPAQCTTTYYFRHVGRGEGYSACKCHVGLRLNMAEPGETIYCLTICIVGEVETLWRIGYLYLLLCVMSHCQSLVECQRVRSSATSNTRWQTAAPE